ncbi:phenylalanine--tRNA ligase subunit beta [Bacillus sp. RG28]|uniref:Phenylalanine--tRNA ligase beta subunit n=1 Tax=Gottfriedia endophytica TaxID=2820819 RepID=A0A940SJA0_9BACI|nr:phenylalanine--tRNA ligase subunit beta [Gottfriedia endophytica]MBP0724008.1 phenylalanine--tRNA ligase subunit beta [Gottfriedia endophytica]
MFVSTKWLQDYVDLSGVTPEELANLITKAGIEVEGVNNLSEGIKNVVVGYVMEREQHPQADKLNKCTVDVGEEQPLQIICGAPNVDKGQKVIVAKIGAVLPGNFKIKKAKLRGEVSEGMICSLQEIGIEGKVVAKEFSNGIFVLPNDAEVGTDALEYLHLNDSVLELGLTPNRADCLNMIGVAYEVAAVLDREVKLPKVGAEVTNNADFVNVTVEAKEDAPFYAAKLVKGVKIGPSPIWMQSRLMSAGIRPINNVVDITNYILIEYGQPLHAFDYNKLNSQSIIVRNAKADEKITTLDGEERTLQPHNLVIATDKEAVAIAGVMGGQNSEVDENTTDVLIESAVFRPLSVRQTSKELGLRSESSARFEKGIDSSRTLAAGERAAELVVELAGGTLAPGTTVENNLQVEEQNVTVTVQKINSVLGTDIDAETVKDIFRRLRLEAAQEGESFTVTVPLRRGDITIEEDLVEEVGRLYGYDHIPATLPTGVASRGQLTSYQAKRRRIRRYLSHAGLFEAVTYSLTSGSKVKRFALEAGEASPVRLALPMSEERSELRFSLVPHLLDAVSYNVARKEESVHLFEAGSVFLTSENNELPHEEEYLAGALTGLWLQHAWQGEKKAVDFYVVKGILDGLFNELALSNKVSYVAAKKEDLHPGRTASILIDGNEIGFIGQVHPSTQKEWNIKETYVFQLSLAKLLNTEVEEILYEAIPRFPSMNRDMALVVDSTVVAGEMVETIRSAGGKLLKDVTIFDLYEGDKMEAGKKSIAFSLTYFDPERTLTDEEVTKVHEKVLKSVEETHNAQLRG